MAAGRTYDEFVSDLQFRLAVERCAEIIGEAAAHVSIELRATCHDIPWLQIDGLRNILVHGYAQLDHKKPWLVVQNNVQPLVDRLSPLVDEGAVE